jgi:hypothetical protein
MIGRTAASLDVGRVSFENRDALRGPRDGRCHDSGGFGAGRGFVVRNFFFRRRGKFVRGGRVGDGNFVVRSCSLPAARRGVRRGVEWRLCEWAHNLLTSCLTYTLRSATVRESGYISEKVFSVAWAVTCVSGELKTAGNVLTGGQRVG